MVLYAGFDIGIKNLAFCIIDSDKWNKYITTDSTDPGIIEWTNLNLVETPKECDSIKKNGEKCTKTARFQLNNNNFCGTHKSKNEKYTKIKISNCKNTSIQDFKYTAFQKLDKFKIFDNVEYIALESQPRFNQQMKMFAASIEAYFILRQHVDNNNLCTIRNSPAKNKLKKYNGTPISIPSSIKGSYNCRKYLAQKQTEYFLSKSPEILNQFFNNNKKKDDLADAFLHCICGM